MLILALMSLGQTLYAQNDPTLSRDGLFRVDYVKGCAPLTVEIVNEYDSDPDVTRWYGLSIETATEVREFTLTTPGEYYIYQKIQNVDEVDRIRIEVEEPKTPYFKASNCGNQTVMIQANRDSSQYDYYIINGDPALELNADNGFQQVLTYESQGAKEIFVQGMYRGEGTSNAGVHNNCSSSRQDIIVTQQLDSASIQEVRASIPDKSISIRYTLQLNADQYLEYQLNGSGDYSESQAELLTGNQFSLTEADPEQNYYCFRIRTDNPCNGTSIYSNTVCTARLSGTAEENQNTINFSTHSQANPEAASLQRNGSILHLFDQPEGGTYHDEEINCNTEYNYSLALSYPGATSITEGLSILNELSGAPPAPENLASHWEGSSVTFEFLHNNALANVRYRAFRAEGSPPKLVNNSQTASLPLPAGAQNTCFRFGYVDACNNESVLTEPVCALYLQNIATEPDGLELTWNEYTGYANGVRSYVVNKYDAEGNFLRSIPAGLQTSLELGEQPLRESGSLYSVTAFPNDVLLKESSSNLFEFRIRMEGYFPNAFTPNNDGHNDFFKAEGKFVEKYRLQIYDRWGRQIFESHDAAQGWDGTIAGQPAVQGTYMFRAHVETMDGAQQTHQGTVFLLRR